MAPPRPSRPKTAFRPKRTLERSTRASRGPVDDISHPPRSKDPIPAVQDYEHKHQAAFFAALTHINHRAAQLCTYSHQNGFLKKSSTILRAWREGAKKGTPDIFCRYPSNGHHGLYIEMKTPGRKPTPEQIQFLREARKDGYAAHVCYSWEEAMEVWCNYVGIAVKIPVR